MIKAVDLNKIYFQGRTKITAVKNASLDIGAEETVLINGPSGAGKSTLLHLLGGLDKPTSGSLLLDGVDFYSLSDNARSRIRNEKIGFVFQFYHLLGEFTVLENVMLPALMRRGKKSRSRKNITEYARNLLGLVGLEKRASHRPSELSGGESQRAAIARALINFPEVLLCDEPTGNLDSKIGDEIINCLWKLKEEHRMALVIVTHDEHIRDDFDKRYRITDGIIKGLKYGAQSLPEWQVCRQEQS
jgi:lipoprotein-releasing system ATP-binding protein